MVRDDNNICVPQEECFVRSSASLIVTSTTQSGSQTTLVDQPKATEIPGNPTKPQPSTVQVTKPSIIDAPLTAVTATNPENIVAGPIEAAKPAQTSV